VSSFNSEDLRILHASEEVQVETRPDKLIPIWIVVADEHVYVRSVKGLRGQWYQRLAGGEAVQLRADGKTWKVHGEHVDQQQIDRVSEALREKYGECYPRETQMMLESETLPTTLQLHPV
jgi:hypothetical protein